MRRRSLWGTLHYTENNMKKIITLVCIVLGMKVSSQELELPQYINHMADNPFLISPSYAGIGAGLQFRLNGVSQWIGVKDAPNTQSLTVEARLAERFGGGITLFNDSNGFTKQTGAKLSLASHITLSDFHDSFLSFALSGSFTQFNVITDEFIGKDPENVPNISKGTANFDVSMLYRYERFAISVNAANLLGKEIARVSLEEPEILRKYSLYSLYTFKVNNQTELEPSLYTEYFEGSKRSRNDLNVKLRKKIRDGYVWGGVSYTFLNDQFGEPIAISPMVGLKKEKFYVSYGLTINTNKTQEFSYGTHMITLGLDYDRRPSLARCTQKMIMF